MKGINTALLGLATLAALGLATALPQAARAQTLTPNFMDNVTVNSTGTHGTVGGQPINNATTAYSNGNPSTVETQGAAAFTLGTGGSLTATGPDGIALYAEGSGPVVVTGGTLTANAPFGHALYAFSGPVTVTGGVFTANGPAGSALFADNTSTVTIAGGSFSATGQSSTGLAADGGGSTLDLFSLADTPFLVNNVSMNNTPLTPNTFGTISGTLLDGQAFSTTFYAGPNATFNLNVGTPPVLPTPEPSAFVGLGIGLLGLGALTVKARRRSVCAA